MNAYTSKTVFHSSFGFLAENKNKYKARGVAVVFIPVLIQAHVT